MAGRPGDADESGACAAGLKIIDTEHFNAMATHYTWDNADRLTGIAHNGPTNLVAYNFVLDANGNRTPLNISLFGTAKSYVHSL